MSYVVSLAIRLPTAIELSTHMHLHVAGDGVQESHP